METVTVGSKYQIVIPKNVRKKIKGFRPGTKVSVSVNKDKSIKVKPSTKQVDRTYGFMKEAWKDIDPIAELEKMRDEWDQKL
jgi:AbrB family looped-hinge helix DNA binding protein